MFRAWFGILEVLAHRFHQINVFGVGVAIRIAVRAEFGDFSVTTFCSLAEYAVSWYVPSLVSVYVQQIQRISTGLLLYCIVGIVKFSGERTFSGENSEGICDTGTYRIFSANKRYVSYKFPFNSDSPSVISPAKFVRLKLPFYRTRRIFLSATACRSSSSYWRSI
jgi:hypothetical protein